MMTRKTLHRLILVLWLSLTIASTADAQSRGGSPRVERDLVYRRIGGTSLKLDLATPVSSPGLRPAILFIHGGGWRAGNRRAYSSEIVQAARRGYVALTITYRLTRPAEGVPAAAWPAQYDDAKTALEWLRQNAAKYSVDPARIVTFGESAGGHLSMLVALRDRAQQRVRAVVNFFGPVDLAQLYSESGATRAMLQPFLGGTPTSRRQIYAEASPIRYVDQNAPSIITFHGDRDTLVPTSQARMLDQAMKRAGRTHQLRIAAGEAHGFKGAQRRKYFGEAYARLEPILKQAPSKVVITTGRPAKPTPKPRPSASSRTNSDRAAAEWVLRIGGSVTLAGGKSEIRKSDQLPTGSLRLTKVMLNRNPRVTDTQLQILGRLPHLEFINLNGTKIGNNALSSLATCPNLNTIGLFGTKITDEGLVHLRQMKQLRTLILQNTSTTKTAIDALRRFVPNCNISR